MPGTMSRGRLAALAAVNGETIRYYERIGLTPEPARTPAGHRRYSDADLARLRFIKRARELGFEVAQTRELISMSDGGADCRRAESMARRNAAIVRAKIRDLKTILRTLEEMADRCARESSPHCPLIEALEAAAESE